MMRIELLYFDGCPGHRALLRRLSELMAAEGVDARVEMKAITSPAHAERERFLGSPTLRVDGEDVDQSARKRADYGLKCRLYATPGGLSGNIPDELVVAALTRPSQARELTTDT